MIIRCGECVHFQPGSKLGICKKNVEWMAPEWCCEGSEIEELKDMKCVNGYEIHPMKSGAGWYMGTCTEEGFPQCRVTANYYKSAEEAEKNMLKDYRECSENKFCSKGLCCFQPVK